MMLRIWLTSTGLGIICAWYAGLDPLSPYLYEWIILGGIAFAAGILMLTFGLLGSQMLVLMIVGTLPIAMYFAEHLLARDIKPSNAFHRFTANPPVGLTSWVDHDRLYGRITNRHPRDWLRLALVTCHPVYANGNPSERELKVSVGEGGWLAPGEGAEAPLVSAQGLFWEAGFAIELTRCWVASADMYEAPAATPKFTYDKDAENRYVFWVTNNRADFNLTRVSFSCWVTFDGRRSKTDLVMRPLYSDGSTYSLPPGRSIALYNREIFSARQLDGCAVRDASWQ